jgi:hypothetical protein
MSMCGGDRHAIVSCASATYCASASMRTPAVKKVAETCGSREIRIGRSGDIPARTTRGDRPAAATCKNIPDVAQHTYGKRF